MQDKAAYIWPFPNPGVVGTLYIGPSYFIERIVLSYLFLEVGAKSSDDLFYSA